MWIKSNNEFRVLVKNIFCIYMISRETERDNEVLIGVESQAESELLEVIDKGVRGIVEIINIGVILEDEMSEIDTGVITVIVIDISDINTDEENEVGIRIDLIIGGIIL